MKKISIINKVKENNKKFNNIKQQNEMEPHLKS